MPDKNFIYTDLYILIFQAKIQFWEYILFPVFFLIIFYLARRTQRNKINANFEYKYYVNGLLFKMLGVFCFCMIYTYYYDGGDTFVYFNNARGMSEMLFNEPLNFFSIMGGNLSSENFSIFAKYNYQFFYWKDPQAFFVVRLTTPLIFFGIKGYLLTSIITAYITYSGVWKLYQVFYIHFPKLHKEFAIAIIFMPSVAFWGSGILKDSWTLAAAGWLTYSFYQLFIKKGKTKYYFYFVAFFISSYIIISIKPYILYSLFH